MCNGPTKNELERVLEQFDTIKNKSMVILTGAGISMNAGLPSGPGLVQMAVAKLAERIEFESEVADTVASSVPLELFFQVVSDHAGQSTATKVTSVLDGKSPNAIHKWVAKCIAAEWIHSVFTFNFDTLQEQALKDSLSQKSIGRSLVLKPDSESWSLTKLHGCSTVRGVISIDEYVQGFTKTIRSQLLAAWQGRLLLVLGYGGWDADLRVAIDQAIERNLLPKTVVWVDQSFPAEGGRTDILSELKSAGVRCELIQADLDRLIRTNDQALESSSTVEPHGFDYDWSELDAMSSQTVRAVVAEVCLLAGKFDWASKLCSELSGNQRNRIEALLHDRQGNTEFALLKYEKLFESDLCATTLALCATRAFTLSSGKVDLLDEVPIEALPIELGKHFQSFVQTRRSDLGGLDREAAAHMIRKLPQPFKTATGVEKLDTVRLYVFCMAEAARILHEARDFANALKLDKLAFRFADALGDPVLKAMTAGGIGVCFTGLAEESREDSDQFWCSAERWLGIAIRDGRHSIGDYIWALHICNLGQVLSERGDPSQGIAQLEKGLPVLTKAYPNWAVSCYGFLAEAYCDIYVQSREPAHFSSAIRTLAKGWWLAEELDDFDDAHILLSAGEKIRTVQ